ncbi:MAG TPA: hypothetical protein VH592_05075 [Gemmataceae bacterium]
MSSEAFLVLFVGLAGIVIGVIAMIVISHRRVEQKTYRSRETEKAGTGPEEAETLLVLGEAVDLRELRIVRALFGEPKGRFLGSFKAPYYRPSLEATIDKDWIKPVGRRFYLTPKGEEFCRSYLEQLLHEHQPAAKV